MSLSSKSKTRRRVTPVPGTPDSDHLDEFVVSSAIINGDDLGPLVRKTFSSGKPDSLLHHLRHFSKLKNFEIEDVCKAHYQDFILAVDDLRSLLSDVDSLKSSLSHSNSLLQQVANPLLSVLESFIESQTVKSNIAHALHSTLLCQQIADICVKANANLEEDNFYLALKCVDQIERDYLEKTPSKSLKNMLQKQIPEIRSHVERKIGKEFSDWLVQIRVVCRELGQLAIGLASSARQREEELRVKQRQAEEQSRFSLRDCVYELQTENEDENEDPRGNNNSSYFKFDLTPLYRCHHIHQTLGLQERFRQYYFENRKLQLTSDFQVSSMTPFLESHQTFFAQIAGFFIVEDRILRTSGGLISRPQVESLWDTAVGKMCSVLEDQFSRMQTANHLLLIKDYVSLLSVTLRQYYYPVEALLEVLSKHSDKYHELLLSDCRKQISDALAGDKLEQMMMRKEYEYNMNVAAFQLQTSDIVPAFPYIASFSAMVPDCCRIVRSFIEDSVSFMSYGGQLDYYDIVKKYLDRLLGEVLDGALLKLINSQIHGVSQAMQVAANMAVMERACDYFYRHAGKLSGIPLRMAERGRRPFPLNNARDAAEELLCGLLKAKVDGFMFLMDNVNWIGDEISQNGNEYVNEVIIYLETLVSTAQQILPAEVLVRVLNGVLKHISERIVGTLFGDGVKRFNGNALTGLDADLKLLESFADNQTPLLPDSNQLRQALAEARQLINLLLSNHPENFLNPVIREKSYGTLDYKKVVTIAEKFRDSSDRLFGTFGSRGLKQNPKKKSLDALIRRLREVS